MIYPLVYILTNVIADVYGERTAQRTLVLGIAADVLFVFMTTLILFLPSPDFFTGDAALSEDNKLKLIDQTKLPDELTYVYCSTYQEVIDAIKTMVVRGAPAIGVSAAFGMALAIDFS